jgi:hypothetical protein
MKTIDIIGSIIGVIFLFSIVHFPMRALIRSQLKVNPNQADGFLFRLKAAKAPILLLLMFFAAIYGVIVLGYIISPNQPVALRGALLLITGKILIVAAITFPVILYNLLSYKWDEKNKSRP